MSVCSYYISILSFLLALLFGINNVLSKPEEYKTYIVHLDHSQKPSSFLTHETWHQTILKSLSKPVHGKEMLLYSYNHVMNGFSARLTPAQVSKLKKSPAHIAIHEEKIGKLFTTHSPKFMGLRHSSCWCKEAATDCFQSCLDSKPRALLKKQTQKQKTEKKLASEKQRKMREFLSEKS